MCGLETILACFSLSGFYVDASLEHLNKGYGELSDTVISQPTLTKVPPVFSGGSPIYVESVKLIHNYSVEYKPQTIAVAAIGYSVTVSRVTARLSVARDVTSSRTIAEFGITWRPFK